MPTDYDCEKQKSTSTQLWSHTRANKQQAVLGKEYSCMGSKEASLGLLQQQVEGHRSAAAS